MLMGLLRIVTRAIIVVMVERLVARYVAIVMMKMLLRLLFILR